MIDRLAATNSLLLSFALPSLAYAATAGPSSPSPTAPAAAPAAAPIR